MMELLIKWALASGFVGLLLTMVAGPLFLANYFDSCWPLALYVFLIGFIMAVTG